MPEKTVDPLLVARIVRSYTAHNSTIPSELPSLIATVHRSLAELGKHADTPPLEPAMAVKRSYGRDFVACLDCGWRGQMLRRHLTVSHGLSASDYRARWGLKDTHPIVARAYAERRSALAKELGLGRKRLPPAPPTEPALDPKFVASLSQPKRRRHRGDPSVEKP